MKTMIFSRQCSCALRRLGSLLCVFGLLLGTAWAQPDKPLRFIVPFQAGGTADVLPRIVGEQLRARYPGGVVVENHPGAGGNIGALAAFRSPPDGSTLFASPPGPLVINQHLYRSLPFDPARWVPVTVLATIPNVLAVSNSLPVRSVGEFIAYVKANPGKVSFASQGNGSTPHLTAALFMQSTGTTMLHVPYKGSAPAQADLIGGQVDCFFDNLSASKAFHDGGKFRILAIADDHRSPVLPDVPTFKEAGLPSMTAVTWFAVVAPPGTEPATVAKSYEAISAALRTDAVRESFAAKGASVAGWTPEETRNFIQTESTKWKRVIDSAHVRID
jgi:tripartite-type tricarboxylate transporter receptor subunit TctC